MSPLISVIVPCYNVEQYLPACIESIIADKNANIELLLIDDGSPDKSGYICDEYAAKDSRIKVIHQKNGGVSAARNAGLDIAKGKWIWFVDGDDRIVNHSFDVLIDTLNKYECDTIFFGLIHVDGENETVERYNLNVSQNKEQFLAHTIAFFSQKMLFSNFLITRNHLRFTVGVSMAEDLEFQYKYLINCNKPISITDALYVYNHREGSATKNPDTHRRNVIDCLGVCERLLNYLKEKSIGESKWISIRVRTLLKSGIQSTEKLKQSDLKSVQKQYRQIVDGYKRYGFKRVVDRTLFLAYLNLKVYILALRIFYKLKK
jgi:glycosyltransferase involved in cell wall biosynthesis